MQSAKVKSRWLYLLLIIFAFFPYIQLIPLGTDSQPNTLLVAMVIFLLSFNGKTPKIFWGLLLVSLGSVLVFFIPPINFVSFRSLSNYLGLFIISYATYFSLSRLRGLPYNIFCKIVYVWFIVGSIQLFVNHDFLSFLIPRGDAGKLLMSGRGINCLTPEPTFYGLMCILMGIVAYINFNGFPKVNRIYILLGIQLVLYSRSTLSIFILLGSFIFYYVILFFRNADILKSILKIGLLSVCILVLINYAEEFLVQYRVGRLLVLVVNNPEKFLVLDESVNERFVHLFFPIYAFITDLGIPHGYNTFSDYMQHCFTMSQFYDIITPHVKQSIIVRILSGLGGTLYELGLFGFIFILYLYTIFKKALSGKARIFIYILFMLIMANAMTFSNPLVAFFIGNIIYLGTVNSNPVIRDENLTD